MRKLTNGTDELDCGPAKKLCEDGCKSFCRRLLRVFLTRSSVTKATDAFSLAEKRTFPFTEVQSETGSKPTNA